MHASKSHRKLYVNIKAGKEIVPTGFSLVPIKQIFYKKLNLPSRGALCRECYR